MSALVHDDVLRLVERARVTAHPERRVHYLIEAAIQLESAQRRGVLGPLEAAKIRLELEHITRATQGGAR